MLAGWLKGKTWSGFSLLIMSAKLSDGSQINVPKLCVGNPHLKNEGVEDYILISIAQQQHTT